MAQGEAPFRTLSLFEEETIPVDDASLQWIPVRRKLGIRAFGTNAYRAARAGDRIVEEHVETPGQEEVYFVIRGAARFDIGGETVEAPAGTAVFVPDPEVRRGAIAAEDETVVLGVGGWPGQPYHSLPWEIVFLAHEPMRQGDWAAAAEILEREAGEHRENGFVRFHLARCYARLGDTDRALTELRGALEASPGLRERAAGSEDLASLRGVEGSPI